MSDLFGNHIVGFPTRRLKCCINLHCKNSRSTGWLYMYLLREVCKTGHPNKTVAIFFECKTLCNTTVTEELTKCCEPLRNKQEKQFNKAPGSDAIPAEV